MPIAARAAASARAVAGRKGKRRERDLYAEDEEEVVGLLGEEHRDDDQHEEEEPSTPKVCIPNVHDMY